MEDYKKIPVYKESVIYAHDHKESEQYRASYLANVACRDAIEEAIREHYRDNVLCSAAAAQVVDRFGIERVLHVLAVTVRHKDWDGRISSDNKNWAWSLPITPNMDRQGMDRSIHYSIGTSHPGLINLFVNQARKLAPEQHRVSVHDQLQKPAQHTDKKASSRKEEIR